MNLITKFYMSKVTTQFLSITVPHNELDLVILCEV